jgi:hypothetical protein
MNRMPRTRVDIGQMEPEAVMNKPLPVPPQNRSPKGTGDDKATSEEKQGRVRPKNPHQQGQQANTEQNTTHQGYQQDR